ncbi:MAG TPA: alpha/beta family hydrolase [Gemmatimonadaceae bacterium]
MSALHWTVGVGADETPAVYEPPTSGDERAIFVCAHGAGGSMNDRSTLAAANALRTKGFGTVRFNFVYKTKGSGRPDPMPVLKKCVEAVVARTRAELAPRTLLIGGRSMGGRAASMLAAEGFASDGLLLLAYPLHPAGKPEQLRDAHLPSISMPTLCLSGTRDALCTRELMERVLANVGPRFRVHWLEGADHSWHVLKSSGRTDADVLDEAARVADAWLRQDVGV